MSNFCADPFENKKKAESDELTPPYLRSAGLSCWAYHCLRNSGRTGKFGEDLVIILSVVKSECWSQRRENNRLHLEGSSRQVPHLEVTHDFWIVEVTHDFWIVSIDLKVLSQQLFVFPFFHCPVLLSLTLAAILICLITGFHLLPLRIDANLIIA